MTGVRFLFRVTLRHLDLAASVEFSNREPTPGLETLRVDSSKRLKSASYLLIVLAVWQCQPYRRA